MSKKKKQVRKEFRESCFKRDNYSCVTCGFSSNDKDAEKELDAHHITDRNEIENGGYVLENGITLCKNCHVLAEQYHSTGVAAENFSPDELYEKIGSSYEKAVEKSKNKK